VFYVFLGINPQQVPEGTDKKKYKREKMNTTIKKKEEEEGECKTHYLN
jgi:hypothetical protein